VGFRPFIYRLATGLGLTGWVNNSPQGVVIEAEGGQEQLEAFLLRIEAERPPRAFIQGLESWFLDPAGYAAFEIRASEAGGAKTAVVLPDIAPCPDCLREVLDPGDRRYRYPFINCTNCGPRFSIVEALPYDRPNTTMRGFEMCGACRAEYEDPMDRRFHAQPNACPACGPHLELWDRDGRVLASHQEALLAAAEAVRDGAIVGVKGVGGFHLVMDARREEAVCVLRQRKRREEKPFALMYPSLLSVEEDCEVSDLEGRLLRSPEAPIVLLRRQVHRSSFIVHRSEIAPSVAPGNPCLGVMLPPTPLHHLLMSELNFPVVATSGNLSDEPICTDEREALRRLGGIADAFLVHDRPIARHVDDSVARVAMGRELVLRRARGYAPLPIPFGGAAREPSLLSVGAHQKNTVAACVDGEVFISQHVGDLETAQAFNAFRRVLSDLRRLYDLRPAAVACDLHPDYLSTRFARGTGLPVVSVQHHHAHVLSCVAENELEGPVLGVSWDGTGYGPDGTVWGGEFLRVTGEGFERVGHLRQFRLPGGEKAVKEPRRAALGLLYEVFGDAIFVGATRHPACRCNDSRPPPWSPLQGMFSSQEIAVLQAVIEKGLNAPVTSSAGRLFDGVAALAGLRHRAGFEGQAAMELEFALDGVETEEAYPFGILDFGLPIETSKSEIRNPKSKMVVDWAPMAQAVLDDTRRGTPVGEISAKFHNTLAEAIVAVARRIGEERVVLTGGCFQNRYLTERAVRRLKDGGFRPYWHQRVPPNDGGIALGQAVAAARSLRDRRAEADIARSL
jgi:hydrogenase maturation protein HypF